MEADINKVSNNLETIERTLTAIISEKKINFRFSGNYKAIIKQLNEQLVTTNKIASEQERKIVLQERENEAVANEIVRIKDSIEMANREGVKRIEIIRKNSAEETNERKRQIREIVQKESKFIKMVVGLDIIKQNFIEKNETATFTFDENQEFNLKLFSAKKLSVLEDGEKVNFDDIDLEENGKESNFELNYDELMAKFACLNIEKKRLFEFNSSLQEKIKFFQSVSRMMKSKEIELEVMKDKYTTSVIRIIEINGKDLQFLISINKKTEDVITSIQNMENIRKIKAKNNQEVNPYKKEVKVDKVYKINLPDHPEMAELKNNINFLAKNVTILFEVLISSLNALVSSNIIREKTQLKNLLVDLNVKLKSIIYFNKMSSKNYVAHLIECFNHFDYRESGFNSFVTYFAKNGSFFNNIQTLG